MIKQCIQWYTPGSLRFVPVGTRTFGEPEFERCSGTENFLGTCRILDAGQLYHDARVTLLLDHRFCYTQFVNAVAQGDDILLQRRPFLVTGCDFGQLCIDHEILFIQLKRQFTELVFQAVQCLVHVVIIAKADLQAVLVACCPAITNLLASHVAADIRQQAFFKTFDRSNHVDFHQEVHTTAQIKAEVHGCGIKRTQPARGGRCQVESDQVLFLQ